MGIGVHVGMEEGVGVCEEMGVDVGVVVGLSVDRGVREGMDVWMWVLVYCRYGCSCLDGSMCGREILF